jgi:uncharacterized membrane protein
MWFRWMAIALIANGLSQFGTRILQEMGLADSHAFLYLAFWYTAGLVVALIMLVAPGERITRKELLIGSAMGVCSSLGWLCLTTALGQGLVGYVAYPVAVGGSMSIVTLVGILAFKERLTIYGYLGVACGILGITMLVIP